MSLTIQRWLQRENRRSRRQSSFGIRDYNLYRGSYETRGLCRLWVYKDQGGLLWGAAVTWEDGRAREREREREKEREKAARWSSVKRFSLWMPETERHCSARGYENLTRRNSGFNQIVIHHCIHSRLVWYSISFFLVLFIPSIDFATIPLSLCYHLWLLLINK